jgi:hypothetical protein
MPRASTRSTVHIVVTYANHNPVPSQLRLRNVAGRRQALRIAVWTRRLDADEIGMRYNEIQNLNGHMHALSSYLIRVYFDARVALR